MTPEEILELEGPTMPSPGEVAAEQRLKKIRTERDAEQKKEPGLSDVLKAVPPMVMEFVRNPQMAARAALPEKTEEQKAGVDAFSGPAPEQKPEPAPPGRENEELGVMDDFYRIVGGAAVDGVKEMMRFAYDVGYAEHVLPGVSREEYMKGIDMVSVPNGEGLVENLTRDMARFFGAYGAVRSAMPGVAKGVGQEVQRDMVAGAVADATMLNPDEQNLSAMLKENFGIDNPFINWLAEPADSPMAQRAKNAFEGAIIGVFANTLVEGSKWGVKNRALIKQRMTTGRHVPGSMKGQRGMVSWHGTPHTYNPTETNPLGDFSLQYVGTGEGAQAFGHGLYVAENKGVARYYRDSLSSAEDGIPAPDYLQEVMEVNAAEGLGPRQAIEDIYTELMKPPGRNSFMNDFEENLRETIYKRDYEDKVFADEMTRDEADEMIAYEIEDLMAPIERDLNQLGARMREWANDPRTEKLLAERVDELRSGGITSTAFDDHFNEFVAKHWPKRKGNLYEIDVPDEAVARMLQGDRTVAEQPENVRQALLEIFDEVPLDEKMTEEQFLKSSGQGAYDYLAMAVRERDGGQMNWADQARSKAELSRMLAERGVPGNRYLDGQSRTAGQPDTYSNYNMVVWDDSITTVVGRNDFRLPEKIESPDGYTLTRKGREYTDGESTFTLREVLQDMPDATYEVKGEKIPLDRLKTKARDAGVDLDEWAGTADKPGVLDEWQASREAGKAATPEVSVAKIAPITPAMRESMQLPRGVGTGDRVSYIKNPDEATLKRWAGRDVESVRWTVDKNGDVYVWDANDAIHRQMEQALGLKPAYFNSDTPSPVASALAEIDEFARPAGSATRAADEAAPAARAADDGVPAAAEATEAAPKAGKQYPPEEGWAPMTVKEIGEDGKPVYKQMGWGLAQTKDGKPLRGPARKGAITRAANKLAGEVRKVMERATGGDEAAQYILKQANWYRSMRKRLREEFGGLGDLFADKLGAASPNTPVETNWHFAVDALKRFVRGDFDKQLAKLAKHLDEGGQISKFPDTDIIRQESGAQYGLNSRNLMLAMLDLWRSTGKQKGAAPKARNFSGNLIGTSDEATIDVWAARILRRVLGKDRIPPPAETGVGGTVKVSGEPGGDFGFGQDIFRKAAADLGMEPDELQAVAWFIEKELWGNNGWTNQTGGSFDEMADAAGYSRMTAGISRERPNAVPTLEDQLAGEAALKSVFRNQPKVLAYKARPTIGRFMGQDERAFDVEIVVAPGHEPAAAVSQLAALGKQYDQDSIFVSRVLKADEDSPNARPGIEVYLKDRQAIEELEPILASMEGTDGFTFSMDLRAEGAAEGAVGIRVQWIPEFEGIDPDAFEQAAADATIRLGEIVDRVQREHADKVSLVMMTRNDTVVINRERYDDYIAAGSGAGDPGAGVPAWFGRSGRENVAGATGKPGQAGGDQVGAADVLLGSNPEAVTGGGS